MKVVRMSEKAYLHDANVTSIEIDVVGKVLRIHVSRHLSPSTRERVASIIEFGNVQSFSGVLDFMALASNAWAGNVEDWEPSDGFGLNYVYFARGVVSIYSDEPVIL